MFTVKDDLITVEVAYARPDEQRIIELQVPPGTTVAEAEAIARSSIIEYFPEIDFSENKLGVFGKLAKLDKVLEAGDRVEIYRPLIADPKDARKKRAAQGKTMKKGACLLYTSDAADES